MDHDLKAQVGPVGEASPTGEREPVNVRPADVSMSVPTSLTPTGRTADFVEVDSVEAGTHWDARHWRRLP